MPRRKDRDWKGVIASLLVHAVILFLILGPIVGSTDFTRPDVVGGGGPGPAGGGGGGADGMGSREQRVEFVRVKSDPTTMPKVTPQTVPPVKPAAAPHRRSGRDGEAWGSRGRISASRSIPAACESRTTGMVLARRVVRPPVKSAAPYRTAEPIAKR